jgi:hypothetical protein
LQFCNFEVDAAFHMMMMMMMMVIRKTETLI